MAPKTQSDSVEWMRRRWSESGEPSPPQFAAMASILRTTAVMTAEIDRVLKGHKLNRTAYLVLVTLQMSRDFSRPLGQVGKALLVHPTTVTMVIDQLEKPGLVSRVPHPSDRRTILACLTEKGEAAVKEASASLAEVDFGLTGTDDETSVALIAELRKVREGLGDFG